MNPRQHNFSAPLYALAIAFALIGVYLAVTLPDNLLSQGHVGDDFVDPLSSRTIFSNDILNSQLQASALLSLMDDEPGRPMYQIIFDTPGEVIIFGCDLEKNKIVRVHQRASKDGSQEAWDGYALDRLNAAARGGTLNDTPHGKIYGTHEVF